MSVMSTWQLAVFLLAFGWTSASSQPAAPLIVNVPVPFTVPSGASGSINKQYPGFGIAVHAFANYAGNSSTPNVFSANLINNIGIRTGSVVSVRVGGTSGDYAEFVPTLGQAIQFPPGSKPGGIPRGLKIGSSFFQGFKNFQNVTWTYMAHFAVQAPGAMANSVASTLQAVLAIGDNLDAIEIGNEVDLYVQGSRPKNWGIDDYISEWKQYASAIQAGALANTQYANKPIFQAPVYAWQNRYPFLINNTFNSGQNSDGNVKYASLHYYQVNSDTPRATLQNSFMNHAATVSNVSIFTQDIQWLQQNQPNVSLVIGETNSDTYSMNNVPLIGVFGAALWMVDYLLYGASIGIPRMSVQLSTGFSYTAWNPVDYNGSPPAVYPSYYSQVFMADVIGSGADVRIANIDLKQDYFSAYAVYDASSGALTKIALVNLQEWNTTTKGTRPSTNALIPIPISFPTLVELQYLTAPGANSVDGVTWAGTEFTYESQGMPNQVSASSRAIWTLGGFLSVPVQASEAVLINIP